MTKTLLLTAALCLLCGPWAFAQELPSKGTNTVVETFDKLVLASDTEHRISIAEQRVTYTVQREKADGTAVQSEDEDGNMVKRAELAVTAAQLRTALAALGYATPAQVLVDVLYKAPLMVIDAKLPKGD